MSRVQVDALAAAGMALTAALVGALVGALVLGRGRGLEAALRRADAVGIFYDALSSSWQLVPLTNVAQNIYKTPAGTLVAVPETVSARPLRPLGKPALFALPVAKVGAKAVSPENLAAMGVVSLALLDSEGRQVGDAADFFLKLVSKEAEETGKVVITPDMQVALAVNVPHIFSSLTDELLSYADAVMQAVTLTARMTKELERLYVERERLAAQRTATWLYWLLALLLAGGVVAFLLTAGRG